MNFGVKVEKSIKNGQDGVKLIEKFVDCTLISKKLRYVLDGT